ncbi:hypothetical protein ACQ4PT_071172 [Festuca glaucescens]
MAPSWVLLDRNLFFYHDETVFAGETEGGRESIGCASEERRKGRPSDEDYGDAIAAYLRSLKPDARLADPPELSYLRMLLPTKSAPPLCDRVTSACISSADKHIVALYAGYYRPGNSNRGCFLIYDARKNSLSTIPQLPFDHSHENIGRHTAVVVCDGDGGGYTLAELVRVESSAGDEAKLYLWHPSAEEWVVKAGRLPPEVCSPDDYFSASMCFHYCGTSLCWVDLLKGILVCDLSEVQRRSSVPKFRFVPLPEGCTTYDIIDDKGQELFPELFRSMACIDGVIKFVTMDGYVERRSAELKLTLWTLSSDFSSWDISKVYDVGNIWENETYQSCILGRIAPSFPVLSMHEANVVYLVFTDFRRGKDQVSVFKGQYVLRVDMENCKVQICQASTTDMIIRSQLFPSEFSAYRHGSADHPQDPISSQ